MAVNKLIEDLLAPVALPLAYREFDPFKKNKPVPDPPYLIYLIDNETARGPDGLNLVLRKRITVELYTTEKNVFLELKVEEALSAFTFEKYEEYLSEERMNMVSYEFEIYQKIRRNTE